MTSCVTLSSSDMSRCLFTLQHLVFCEHTPPSLVHWHGDYRFVQRTLSCSYPCHLAILAV